MLLLPDKLPEAAWHTYRDADGDSPAIRVRFAPIGPASVAAARRAVAASLHVHPDDVESAGEEMSRELLQRGIVGWEGIGGADGAVVEPTRDRRVKADDGSETVEVGTISLFLADQDRFDWADRIYVMPWVARDAEKNASSGSPAGTGQGATPESNIATTPVAAEADAKRAHTASKRRSRSKAKQPGK